MKCRVSIPVNLPAERFLRLMAECAEISEISLIGV